MQKTRKIKKNLLQFMCNSFIFNAMKHANNAKGMHKKEKPKQKSKQGGFYNGKQQGKEARENQF